MLYMYWRVIKLPNSSTKTLLNCFSTPGLACGLQRLVATTNTYNDVFPSLLDIHLKMPVQSFWDFLYLSMCRKPNSSTTMYMSYIKFVWNQMCNVCLVVQGIVEVDALRSAEPTFLLWRAYMTWSQHATLGRQPCHDLQTPGDGLEERIIFFKKNVE